MKAISLWQPWAAAMAAGEKLNETRSWATSYRGPLAICAAKRRMKFPDLCLARMYLDAVSQPLYSGYVLCVVELYDCVPTSEFHMNPQTGTPAKRSLSQAEWDFGNYEPGRYAWLTKNRVRLNARVRVIGRQRLFNLPAEVEAKVQAQLNPR